MAQLSFDQAVELLKKVVKHSHLDNQKHIDLSLCTADQRAHYQKALMVVNAAVARKELSDDELKQRLGLI